MNTVLVCLVADILNQLAHRIALSFTHRSFCLEFQIHINIYNMYQACQEKPSTVNSLVLQNWLGNKSRKGDKNTNLRLYVSKLHVCGEVDPIVPVFTHCELQVHDGRAFTDCFKFSRK